MFCLAATILLAVSRAELVERFCAAPVSQVSGLVKVYADCPADMRREYQAPVAGFAADVCRTLYRVNGMQPVRFDEPGIAIYVGESRDRLTNIVVRTASRGNGVRFTRIYLPAPGSADMDALRVEVAKAFFLAVRGEEVDGRHAVLALRSADPALRAADAQAGLARWREGVYEEGMDDERYLKTMRSVLLPGHATAEDLRIFASRLFLYPRTYAAPFPGGLTSCTFAEAAHLAHESDALREAALRKASEVILYGGGRGDALAQASAAYAAFLVELARGGRDEEGLLAMLAVADGKLKGIAE